MKKAALFIASVFVAALAALPASAQEKELGKFGAWRAFSQEAGGQTVCFMVTTQPVKPNDMRHTPPYLMITHRPIEASRDVFSYGAGITLDGKRAPKIKIAASSFELFSARDTAWARDATLDHRIAKAIKEAKQAIVTAYPDAKGIKPIADRFDVTGAAEAYRAIGIACGLITPEEPKAPAKKTAPIPPAQTKRNAAPPAAANAKAIPPKANTPANKTPVKTKQNAASSATKAAATAKTIHKKQQPAAKTKAATSKKAAPAKKATTATPNKKKLTTKKLAKKPPQPAKEP